MMDLIEIEGKTELELALQVSLLVNEKTDLKEFKGAYGLFVEKIRRRILSTDSVEDFLSRYRETGFVQDKEIKMELWHSDIVSVFEAKQGIPITLGILLIETANRCGFEAKGVNYPGHFLVNVEGELIDPLGLTRLDPNKMEGGDNERQRLLVAVSPLVVFLRMLNNLRALYVSGQQWAKSIEIIDLQMAVSDGNNRLKASFLFDKAELWSYMEAYGVARQCLLDAAEIADDQVFIDQCQEKIIELSKFDQVVH
jgi:regulator of sirC expression with transglutaminase-like and TPR domain